MWALVWAQHCLDRMADVYVGLPPEGRERLAREVAWLNASLRSDPLAVGESREQGFRIAFPPGLMVLFRVDPASGTVRVSGVRPDGRRQPSDPWGRATFGPTAATRPASAPCVRPGDW